MKMTKRALCLLLVGVMLLGMLVGCSTPKLVIAGTPKTVGKINGQEIPTGEYLAYMYANFMDVYFSQGLYQYAQYGLDPWTQEITYGTGDAAQQVTMEDYMRLYTQDVMVQHAVMRQMMEQNGIQYDAEDLKSFDESFASMNEEETLEMGISLENMRKAYMNIRLNPSTLLEGLYGKGGKREVAESELKKYFEENYVSYKIISISLTDEDGKELAADKKKEKTEQLNKYLETYKKDKNFEALVDNYTKLNAAEGTTVEASKDEDNRRNADATDMDEYLVKEIRKLENGEAAVVEYKSGGTTPTAALILRLDINEPKTVFEDANYAILQKLKQEELQTEIDELQKKMVVEFKESATKKFSPKQFEEILMQG